MEKATLISLIDEKMTQREIAKSLNVSHTTIRYWLNRHNLKTKHNRYNKNDFLITDKISKYIEKECQHHGLTTFIYENSRNCYRLQKM